MDTVGSERTTKRRNFLFISILVLSVACAVHQPSMAFGESAAVQQPAKEFCLLSGWAQGDLKRYGSYEMFPLHLQFGWNITSLLQKHHIVQSGQLFFDVEPFINPIYQPDSNVEAGCNALLKYRYPLIGSLSVFTNFGVGLLYTTQHIYREGAQLDFSEQVGGGVAYFFTKNNALTCEYRRRHFSNAGIKEPNAGLNMDYALVGLTFLY